MEDRAEWRRTTRCIAKARFSAQRAVTETHLPVGATDKRTSARRSGAQALGASPSWLQQLPSDPSVRVEGGSANNYDYYSGDPVNGNDLARAEAAQVEG